MTPADPFEDPAEYPGLPKLRGRDRVFRLWIDATFSEPVSYSLYAGRPGLVRRLLLVRNPVSGEREPWGADARVPAEVWEPLARELEGLSLPPFPPRTDWGLDGTRRGVERGDLFLAARLSWWEAPPGTPARWRRWPRCSRRTSRRSAEGRSVVS